jgi:hypothetical protein
MMLLAWTMSVFMSYNILAMCCATVKEFYQIPEGLAVSELTLNKNRSVGLSHES